MILVVTLASCDLSLELMSELPAPTHAGRNTTYKKTNGAPAGSLRFSSVSIEVRVEAPWPSLANMGIDAKTCKGVKSMSHSHASLRPA